MVLWRLVVTVLRCGGRFGATVRGVEDAGEDECFERIRGLDQSVHRKHDGPGWNWFELAVVVLWRIAVAVL